MVQYEKPIPSDMPLYEKAKRAVYQKMPTHSAYRSGHVVKAYKSAFFKKYGENTSKQPYVQNKKPSKTGLSRWFKENWRNQRGEVGYSRRGDVYRPTHRVTSKSPKPFSELSPSQVKRAMRLKKSKGRASF